MRMQIGSLRAVPDDVLLARIPRLLAAELERTIVVLLHLDEVDRRKLFRDAGHSSMYQYCRRGLGMSEDEAFRRIRVIRTARRFPAIFEMIEDGRHHLSSIALLAPFRSRSVFPELLRLAANASNARVRLLIAEHFPRPDVPTILRAIAPPTEQSNVLEMTCKLGPDPVVSAPLSDAANRSEALVSDVITPAPMFEQTPTPSIPAPVETRIAPLSPASYALQCTLSAAAHARLRDAQDLLGPRVARDDVSRVLEMALEALLLQLERVRKRAIVRPASAPAMAGPNPSHDRRYVNASLRRAVWTRDAGRCQFVSASGQRCESSYDLEIDHVKPVSLGGESDLENLRLLCPAHNQLEAERRLGREFMAGMRGRK